MGIKVGIQLYSVRNNMAKDPIKTIGKVAEIGYKYIEIANLNAYEDFGCGFGVEPDELNEAIEPFGAKIVSAHFDPLDEKNVDKILEYHAKLGTKYIMSKSMDLTYEAVMKQCETLNMLGEKCKQYGIKNCLHTAMIPRLDNGRDMMDVYMENTNQDTLCYEVDTYWALRSGLNPVDVLKKLGKRVELLHQKDMPKDNGGVAMDLTTLTPLSMDIWQAFYRRVMDVSQFTEVGDGIMDLQSIIDTALEYTNAEYVILEQDFTKLDEMESIKKSMEGFRKIKNISWD